MTVSHQQESFRPVPPPMSPLPALSHFGVGPNLQFPVPQWDITYVRARALLDRVHAQFLASPEQAAEAMQELFAGLALLRNDSSTSEWEQVIKVCVNHPVRQVLHADPLAARSFNKPRGYSGDAVLIDFLYNRSCRIDETDEVTPLGQRIFAFMEDSPAGRAVRARRDLVAQAVDELCKRVEKPSVLSVACGHLREAMICRSVKDGKVGEFVALDQDPLSLEVVDRELGATGVQSVCNSIKALFRGELADRKFDFIYSTGLYDYLDQRLATKLTARLFEMLNPRGRLLVANFLTDISLAPYMEAFMDWKLIYRTNAEVAGLASGIPVGQIALGTTFMEENQNIAFLDLTRA